MEADEVVESNKQGGKIEIDGTRSTYVSTKFRIEIIEIVRGCIFTIVEGNN